MDVALRSGPAVTSWINLGEVYYRLARPNGHHRAAATITALQALVFAELPGAPLVLAAARIKADHAIAYADAFAVATAEHHRAPLLTGDPEIVDLERDLRVVDLRS